MVYFHVNLLPRKQHITVVEIIQLLPYSLKQSAKSMKSRSCWLIFSLIGLSLTSCGQQKSSQEIAETVNKSLVLISYQNEGGHGTGFIVPGPTGVCTVLTARHVVEGHSLNLQTNDQKLWKTDSIQANPNLDLAVVTFPSADKNCPYPSLELGDSDSVKQTDQIYISGFPDRAGGGKLVRQFVRGSVSGLDVLEVGYRVTRSKDVLELVKKVNEWSEKVNWFMVSKFFANGQKLFKDNGFWSFVVCGVGLGCLGLVVCRFLEWFGFYDKKDL